MKKKIEYIRIKASAIPLGENKDVWGDDDYETVVEEVDMTPIENKWLDSQKDQSEKTDMLDSLPDAVADLSETVSGNASDASDLADALAELSELVSTLVEGKE